MGELGLSFIKLTKFENETATYDTQKTRASEIKNVATACVRGSRIYRELNAKTVKNLVSRAIHFDYKYHISLFSYKLHIRIG